MKRTTAEIVREYGPFAGVDHVHGVSWDGKQVWFAAGDKLQAVDPVNCVESMRTLEKFLRACRYLRA